MRHTESGNCRSALPNAQKKIVEKASNIAQKAAQEAKAASEAQNIAGQQAARQVLNYIILYMPHLSERNRVLVTQKCLVAFYFFNILFEKSLLITEHTHTHIRK